MVRIWVCLLLVSLVGCYEASRVDESGDPAPDGGLSPRDSGGAGDGGCWTPETVDGWRADICLMSSERVVPAARPFEILTHARLVPSPSFGELRCVVRVHENTIELHVERSIECHDAGPFLPPIPEAPPPARLTCRVPALEAGRYRILRGEQQLEVDARPSTDLAENPTCWSLSQPRAVRMPPDHQARLCVTRDLVGGRYRYGVLSTQCAGARCVSWRDEATGIPTAELRLPAGECSDSGDLFWAECHGASVTLERGALEQEFVLQGQSVVSTGTLGDDPCVDIEL